SRSFWLCRALERALNRDSSDASRLLTVSSEARALSAVGISICGLAIPTIFRREWDKADFLRLRKAAHLIIHYTVAWIAYWRRSTGIRVIELSANCPPVTLA